MPGVLSLEGREKKMLPPPPIPHSLPPPPYQDSFSLPDRSDAYQVCWGDLSSWEMYNLPFLLVINPIPPPFQRFFFPPLTGAIPTPSVSVIFSSRCRTLSSCEMYHFLWRSSSSMYVKIADLQKQNFGRILIFFFFFTNIQEITERP